jgi:hypothetical protein
MLSETACEALKMRRRLELQYHGFVRVVEVHAVGFSKNNNPVARIWQVRGGSAGTETVGWKLLRLDQASGGAVLNEPSEAPRPGYKAGDRAMNRILCEL